MSDQPTFDPTPVNDLLEIGGIELVQEIADVFLDDAPSLIADIVQAVETEDWDQLIRASHSLKSSAFYLGAMRLSETGAQIEREAKDQALEVCQGLCQQTPTLFEEAKQALETYQATIPPQE